MSDERFEQVEPKDEDVEGHQKHAAQDEAPDKSEDSDDVEAHSPRNAAPRNASPRNA